MFMAMPIVNRLRYAFYVLIGVTMIVMLALSIGEGIGYVRGVNVERLMLHPLYFLPVLAVGYLVAPILFERIPISGDEDDSNADAKTRGRYTVRSIVLAALGLLLALVANLVVFLFEKFA